jgi:ribonuclease P protein component
MRVGLIVPRFKHSAVARNRLKRQLRELARLRLLPTDLSVDVVLRIQPGAYSATFDALGADVARALVQLTRWRATTSATPPDDISPTSAPTPDA